MNNYYSNGKLLITGEYTVLDGAMALAIPTKFGQSLNVTQIPENNIIWKSIDNENQTWFEDVFAIEEITSGLTNPRNDVSKTLVNILAATKKLNPNFLLGSIETKTGFSNKLGTWQFFNPYKQYCQLGKGRCLQTIGNNIWWQWL